MNLASPPTRPSQPPPKSSHDLGGGDFASSRPSTLWQRIALGCILLLSAGLNFYHIGQEGFANLYYAAAVKSMLTSWRNFFFVSYDAAGFVSVDKPPLGFWVQAASAAIFGFHGWALILPQALAGVLSVWLLYHLVRRTFGPAAGLIAALVLAVTPISVAANRNNTMDSQLVLISLLAAWAALLAAERGKLRWLLLSAALIGVGFNIKMLQAFMVLPAVFLIYLLAPLRWWKRLLHLALATILLLIVSLSWAVAVDLTPPENRPYVGSSQDNTVTELIIGHNGMERLLPGGLRRILGFSGTQPGGGQPPAGQPRPGGQPRNPPLPGMQPGQPPASGPGQSQPPGDQSPTQNETGGPGIFRLFNQQLAGQISWLLPLALLGSVAAWFGTQNHVDELRPETKNQRLSAFLRVQFSSSQHKSLLFWLLWLLPQIVFFSFANLFHRYYLAMLAPAIAALVGAGLTALWASYRRDGWAGWLLPLALAVCMAAPVGIAAAFPEWASWLIPAIIGLAVIAAAGLVILRLEKSITFDALRFTPHLFTAIGLAAILLAPAAWSLTPILYGGDSGLPYAGPDLASSPASGPAAENSRVDSRLVDYLQSQYNGETFLFATTSSMDASPFILATGMPVMALGGFSGGDQILTADELAGKVAAGEVRFFLFTGNMGSQQELAQWVQRACLLTPSRDWGGPIAPAGQHQPGGVTIPQLFDCGNVR